MSSGTIVISSSNLYFSRLCGALPHFGSSLSLRHSCMSRCTAKAPEVTSATQRSNKKEARRSCTATEKVKSLTPLLAVFGIDYNLLKSSSSVSSRLAWINSLDVSLRQPNPTAKRSSGLSEALSHPGLSIYFCRPFTLYEIVHNSHNSFHIHMYVLASRVFRPAGGNGDLRRSQGGSRKGLDTKQRVCK